MPFRRDAWRQGRSALLAGGAERGPAALRHRASAQRRSAAAPCGADSDELVDPLVTMLVVARMEPLAALQAEIHALCGDLVTTHLAEDLYMPGWPWLNVHDRARQQGPGDHHAGRALRAAGARAGRLRRPGERPVHVEAAHHAVAVSNASDDVKLAAHRIIGPHHEDAVVHFIREDWAARMKS
ncbi:hypothetical protein Ddc_24908 [Ditylenchus destructor]|nr:hypothetical protein Ddc_24908 [Ditylenchus destructor]